MKKVLLVCLVGVFLLSISELHAQTRTISGTVTSADDGSVLPGVNVVIKGTATGTTTDANGRYSMSVPASGDILVFSFIGLKTAEISIGNRTTIDLQMETDAKQLSEIVIVETGYAQERRFVGSNTVLKGELIERTPLASFDQALQGRVAGVLVNSGSGQPGASANVRIRGVKSIAGAGAQPLYVVDGVPIAGDLSGLNPNDIVSQTVLKDGSAGAIYGARGANGIIVVTTRKGEAGVNAIDFRTQVGISMQPPPMNFAMMNTEQALRYEEMVGAAGFAGITGPGWVYSPLNPSYAAQTEAERARRDGLLAGFRANNRDYYDILFRNGVSTTNELVARGGTETSKYYTSFNAFNQQGFAAGSDFTRYTGRVNVEQKLGKLTLNLNSSFISSETNNSVGDWLGNSPGNPFQIVWRAKPYEQVWREDGVLDFGASTALAPRTIANAIERQENSTYRQRDLRLLGGVLLSYEIVKGLTLRNNLGVDLTNSQGMYSINANSFVGSQQTQNSGFHTEAMRTIGQVVNTSSLNFSQIFADRHEVELSTYFETVKQNNNGFGYSLFNLDKRLTQTGQGAGNIPITAGQTNYPQNGSGAKSAYGIRSYFVTARYTYDDRYTLNFNARQDATSRILSQQNKEIFTWSAGLGWNASSEAFMQNQNVISNLSFRATYGEVPNIGSIQSATFTLPGTFFTIPNYLGRQAPTFAASTAFAGSSLPGLVATSPGDPNLRIEYVRNINVGFDISLFNRANLVVDLYRNTTIDMFVAKPLSATTGFGGGSIDVNDGSMLNKGIEVALSGDIIKQRDWSIDASWNHAMNINEILSLGTVDQYQLGTFLIKPGLPYGSHLTLDYVGADPATGRPVYRKADGTTTFSSADAGQQAIFGTWVPKHTGGFSLGGRYKRLQVSTHFTYQYNVVRSNNVWSWVTRGIPGYANAVNQASVLLTDQWMQPGDQKFYQSPQYDRDFTSADLMDAKFLRFRELMVSYTLPKIKHFRDIRVYARGQNLLIWSPWKGLDPEDNNNISLNEYPNPRMYVFGVDFSF